MSLNIRSIGLDIFAFLVGLNGSLIHKLPLGLNLCVVDAEVLKHNPLVLGVGDFF